MFFGGRFRILNGVFGIPLGVGLGVDSEVTGDGGGDRRSSGYDSILHRMQHLYSPNYIIRIFQILGYLIPDLSIKSLLHPLSNIHRQKGPAMIVSIPRSRSREVRVD